MLIKPPTTKPGRSNITNMTICIAALSASRRCAVRAFSARSLPSTFSSVRGDVNGAGGNSVSTGNFNGVRINSSPVAQPPTTRFSTAAGASSTDRELETALDELLGDVIEEAEHPKLEGERGHIEGSSEFPRGLLDVVSWTLFVFCYYCILLDCIVIFSVALMVRLNEAN